MPVHLHDLIEQVDKSFVLTQTPPGVDSPEGPVTQLIARARRLAQLAICFDVGESTDLDGLRRIPGLFKLPYRTCWFEVTIAREERVREVALVGVLAVQADDDSIDLWFFNREEARGSHWCFFGKGTGLHEVQSQNAGNVALKGGYWPDPEGLVDIAQNLWMYLSALNCINVERVEERPDAKLQSARAKRGKLPLFSTWTLALDLDRGVSHVSGGGGTHASPRLHLRRGHARRIESGQHVWVSAHMVGSKQAGLVTKDYATATR